MPRRTTGHLTSIGDVLNELPNLPVTTSRGRAWPGITVDLHAPSEYYARLPGRDHHLIIFNRKGSGRKRQYRAGTEHDAVHHPGDVIIMPAGTPSLWEGAATGTVRLRILTSLVEECARELGVGTTAIPEIRNVFQTRDPVIERLALLLADEVGTDEDPAQGCLVASLSMALATHLLRSYSGTAARSPVTPRLHPLAQQRVIDRIEATYGEPISLDDLAHVAGLSRFHFARAFRNSLGATPAGYIERIRMDRAMELIRSRRHPLRDVALMLGYSDQSHFTRRFRRRTGMTPAAYVRLHSSAVGPG